MTQARFLHHQKIEKWQLFEQDHEEWQKNSEKYKGITPRPENYAFLYRWKGAEKKTCNRLADIYEFKLQWEKEHDQNTPKQ